MTLEAALRTTEILLGLALIQHSAEHLVVPRERMVFALRLFLSALLVAGFVPLVALGGLALLSLVLLLRFEGPYNGGSDRMALLVLWCLLFACIAPTPFWQGAALGYLAIQLTLSYFISGWVKLCNPEWRSGEALRDVFAFSAYPAAGDLRALSDRQTMLWAGSWAVILFEVGFPLALTSQVALFLALGVAAAFHLANACLFGLNRFFWIWPAAYPSLIWLQTHIN